MAGAVPCGAFGFVTIPLLCACSGGFVAGALPGVAGPVGVGELVVRVVAVEVFIAPGVPAGLLVGEVLDGGGHVGGHAGVHGRSGGGRTCSCNLQPLCRAHHQQKTAGLLSVRAVSPDEEPGTPAGTLEWTLPSGVTCRSHPHIAAPAPIPTQGIPTDGPGAHPADHADADRDADAHADADADRDADADADADADSVPDSDWADRAWQQSRARAAAARADQAARAADATRAAEQARHDAERNAWLADHPPF